MKPGTAIVVAPYHPIGAGEAHFGAATKILGVIRVLKRLYGRVVLVNSAHAAPSFTGWSASPIDTGAGVIEQLLPTTLFWRPFGKLFNLLEAPIFAKRVLHLYEPQVVWLYNGYAFECIFGLCMPLEMRLVLELEDGHFARFRRSPKPWLDHFFLHRLWPRVDIVTAVNSELALSASFAGPCISFPGLVKNDAYSPPGNLGDSISLGYFGGLTKEKGADLVLWAVTLNIPNITFVVTGGGLLAPEFHKLAGKQNNLRFYGAVSSAVMHDHLLSVDAVINPHVSIERMGNAIFPFKVIEALAAGRPVISTALPKSGLPIEDGIIFFDGTKGSLALILRSILSFLPSKANSRRVAEVVATYLSEEAIAKQVAQALELGCESDA